MQVEDMQVRGEDDGLLRGECMGATRQPQLPPTPSKTEEPTTNLPPALPPQKQAVAQGRVWSGNRAVSRKLIDVVGGLWEAVALAKQAAGIEQSEKVAVVEVSRTATSPLALLSGGGASAGAQFVGLMAAALVGRGGGAAPAAALQGAVGIAALQQVAAASAAATSGLQFGAVNPAALLSLAQGLQQGQVLALDVDAANMAQGGSSVAGAGSSSGGSSSFFAEEGSGLGALFTSADALIGDALDEWVL
jgi:hypothetical protein